MTNSLPIPYPKHPAATSQADVVTVEQIVRIRVLANERGYYPDELTAGLGILPEELNRRAASVLISWLKNPANERGKMKEVA